MVRSSFSIQYQSTGIGSLPILSEIGPRQLVRGVALYNIGPRHFPIDVLVKNIFMEISIKLRGACTSKTIVNKANTSTQLVQ